MKKRITAILLSALMLVVLMIPAVYAATDVPVEIRRNATVDASVAEHFDTLVGKFSRTEYTYNVARGNGINPETGAQERANSVGYNHFEIVENWDGSISGITPDNGTAEDGVLCTGRSSLISISSKDKASLGERGKKYNESKNPGYSVTFRVDNEEDIFYGGDAWGSSVSVCFTDKQIRTLPMQSDWDAVNNKVVTDLSKVTLNGLGYNGMRGAGSATHEGEIKDGNAGIYVAFMTGNSKSNAPQYIYVIRDDGSFINKGYDNYVACRWAYKNIKKDGTPIVPSLKEDVTVEIRPDATYGYAVVVNGENLLDYEAGEHHGAGSESTYGDDHRPTHTGYPLDSSSTIDFLRTKTGVEYDYLDDGAYVNVTVVGNNGTGDNGYKADMTLVSLDGGKPIAGVHTHTPSEDWVGPEVTYPCQDYDEYKLCTICGKIYDERHIEATQEHTFGEWVTPEVTYPCAAYERERTCSVCGHQESEIVAPTADHTFILEDIASEPTLTEGGVKIRLCDVCGQTDPVDIEKMENTHEIDKYTDVKTGDWFYNFMVYGIQKKIISGTSATTAAPSVIASRAQFVQMLYNLAGQPDVSSLSNPFTDVKASDWFYKAVVWAADAGVTGGTSPTTFGPGLDLTREQVVAFMFNYASKVDSVFGKTIVFPEVTEDLSAYTDRATVSSWALEQMKWGIQFGLLSGTSDTTVSPKMAAGRSQVVGMLMNYAHTTRYQGVINTLS